MSQLLYLIGLPGIFQKEPHSSGQALRYIEKACATKNVDMVKKSMMFMSKYYLEGSDIFTFAGEKKIGEYEYIKLRSQDGNVLKIKKEFFGAHPTTEGSKILLLRNTKARWAPENFVPL